MQTPTQNREADFQDLCDHLRQQMEQHHVPGLAVGVWDGQDEYTAGLGLTSLDNPLPVTPETLFQVGSITKTFVATAVMRLVESGRLDLDAPVRTYLPGLRLADEAAAAGVTMRHLLSHTGGWLGDYFDDCGLGENALTQIVENMARLEQQTPLGSHFSYNNAGFYLAGRAIESITGCSFEDAMRELVFEPLGLPMAFFFAHDLITYRFATGHQVDGEEVSVARPWAVPRASGPAGGIVSNVPALLKYARFHLGDGKSEGGQQILSPASLALMQTPQVQAGDRLHVGLSWFISGSDELKMINHGGGTKGQNAGLFVFPGRNLAMAALSNSDQGSIAIRSGLRKMMASWLGQTFPDPEPRVVEPETLQQYAGTYKGYLSSSQLSVEGSDLMLNVIYHGGFPTPDSPPPPAPPAMRVGLYAPDKYVVLDHPFKDSKGEFLRSPEGQIQWMRLGLRLLKRQG
jgi:CubicO group peptidase (beta-lactamase class C family)